MDPNITWHRRLGSSGTPEQIQGFCHDIHYILRFQTLDIVRVMAVFFIVKWGEAVGVFLISKL